MPSLSAKQSSFNISRVSVVEFDEAYGELAATLLSSLFRPDDLALDDALAFEAVEATDETVTDRRQIRRPEAHPVGRHVHRLGLGKLLVAVGGADRDERFELDSPEVRRTPLRRAVFLSLASPGTPIA